MADAQERKGYKTYSHLQHLRRVPSEYEVVSTRLRYDYPGGFEISSEAPIPQWYAKHREGSAFQCTDWEKFYDPRQTFYRRYNEIQHRKETFVDQVLQRIDDTGSDENLSPEWLDVLRVGFAPFRYPGHALQMVSTYVGQMAPSGKITNTAAFQGADEMRRIQRIVYRTRQLDLSGRDFEHDDRKTWEDHPVWQPIRECLERLLIAWDWGEAYAGLNLVVKPHVDVLFNEEFGSLASLNGDAALGDILYSLNEDATWHRDWAMALARTAIEDTPENQEVLEGWVTKWYPLARNAIEGFRPIFEEMAPRTRTFDEVLASVDTRYSTFLSEIGLHVQVGTAT